VVALVASCLVDIAEIILCRNVNTVRTFFEIARFRGRGSVSVASRSHTFVLEARRFRGST